MQLFHNIGHTLPKGLRYYKVLTVEEQRKKHNIDFMMLVVNIINHQQQKPHHKLIEHKFSTHIKLIKISMHVRWANRR